MATPPFLIPNLVLNSIGLVKLVGLWVVVSIQSEHVHGVVTPDQPRHASMCMEWSHPINLDMLDGVYMEWSHPINLVTPLSCRTYSPFGMPIRSASPLLPSPLLGSYDPTWVWAADDAKAFI